MAEKVRFTPVMGTDAQIKLQQQVDGKVYFATDTRKIYLDTDTENKISMGGAGNSGIYYGTKELTDEEKIETTIYFSLSTDIEGDECPVENDLILNGGSFYRVISVTNDGTIKAIRLTIAGSGGGGTVTLDMPSYVDIEDLEASEFIYGQPAYITVTPHSQTDKLGKPLNTTGLKLICKVINQGTNEYVEFTMDSLRDGEPVDVEFGTKLYPDVYNTLVFRVESPRTTQHQEDEYAVSCVRLLLKQHNDFKPMVLYGTGFNMVCQVEGQTNKILEFYFDAQEGDDPIGVIELEKDKSGRQELRINNAKHGAHNVEIKLFQGIKNKDGTMSKGVEVPSLKFQIAVDDGESTDPIIWLGAYESVYNNYDNIRIPYMVYTPGSQTSTVRFYKNARELALSPTTLTYSTAQKDFEIFEIIDADVSDVKGEYRDNTYQISSGGQNVFVNFKVYQTGEMNLIAQNSLLVNFDAIGRSNKESDVTRATWSYKNPKLASAKTYVGEFEGFNWYNNGWMTDEDGLTCLRISNGAKFKIPLGTITFNDVGQETGSQTFEFQFKIRNVQNYENLIRLVTRYVDDQSKYDDYLAKQTEYGSYEQYLQATLTPTEYENLVYDYVESITSTEGALCNYFDTTGANVGFCLGTQDMFFKTNKSTLNASYVENRMVNLALVFQKYSDEENKGLVSLYLNGVLSGAALVNDKNAFQVVNDYLTFNSDFCDIDLYKFRYYFTKFEIAEVLNNYAVDKKDIIMYRQSTGLVTQNDNIGESVLDFNKIVNYNLDKDNYEAGRYTMPYMVLSKVANDALSWSKDINMFPEAQFVNTGLDYAYAKNELAQKATGYPTGEYPITWMSAESAAALAEASKEDPSTNYYYYDGNKQKVYVNRELQKDTTTYPQKIKKDKKKGLTTPIYRSLSSLENYYIHHCPSFIAYGPETNVQGTSSQYYPRRNYKMRCKEVMYANKGPFEKDPMYLQYFYMDNDKVGTTKFTMKIDYMESSGSYNTGFCNMVHGSYTKHPLQDYPIPGKPDTQYLRTNILGYPIMMFHQKSNGETIYIGRYNMNLDKGSDENYGFKLFANHDANGAKITHPFLKDSEGEALNMADVAECWEFSDNNRGYCSFRDPDNRAELSFILPGTGSAADNATSTKPNERYRTNSKGLAPIVADSIEYRYHKDGDVLDYLYGDTSDELVKTILEDYEGEITELNLKDPQWRKDYLIEKMSNFEKVQKWVWSTNTDAVDSDDVIYEAYGQATGLGKYEKSVNVYVFEDGSEYEALVFNETETSGITYEDVWDHLTSLGFTEEVMKSQEWGTKDLVASTESKAVYTFTPEDVFEAYAKVTGYTYKSYIVRVDEETGSAETVATFLTGTIKPLSEILVDFKNNTAAYETDKSKALAEPYISGRSEYLYDTKEYRLAKFTNEFTKHFDKEYALVYFIMTEVFMCYDSRGKNAMFASWGPQEEGGEYIWYPLFYDLDTQLGINNTGIPSFEYFVNASQDGCYSTNDSVLWGNIFKCFFEDLKAKYQQLRTDIRRKDDSGEGVSDVNTAPLAKHGDKTPVDYIEDFYTCNPDTMNSYAMRGIRPLVAINMDEYYKYITIMNGRGPGYQGTNGENKWDNSGSFLYALQGDRGLSRQQFLTRRINFIDSWLTQGSYREGAGEVIKFRTSANDPQNTSDCWVDSTTNMNSSGEVVEGLEAMLVDGRVNGYYEVDENGAVVYENGEPKKLNYFDADFFAKLSPYQRSYVTLATDNGPLPSIEYEGSPVRMEFPASVVNGIRTSPQYAEQLLYLYGADYLKDIGDVSLLYPREFELTGATHLQRIILGNDTPGYYNKKLKSPRFDAESATKGGGKPLLKEIVFTNVQIDGQTNVSLNFASSEKLQIFRALGMNLATVDFANGVALHTLHLPASIEQLVLKEARNLSGLISTYEQPTRDAVGNWQAQRGLYIKNVTDVDDVTACANNIGLLDIAGGNMGYDSYRLLNKLYRIKEAQSTAAKKGTLKISLENVNWTPYKLLDRDYIYDPDELDNYYIDNNHYQLVPYKTYDNPNSYSHNGTLWAQRLANKRLYYKDPTIPESDYNIIDSFDMFKDLAQDTANVTYYNPDSIGGEIPRITGNVFINNINATGDDIPDEGWIKNTLQQWYPNLNVFVTKVVPAYSAQFIQVSEIDGSETILETQKISQDEYRDALDNGKSIYFNSPYETYADMTQKDHYDFYGWSTRKDSEAHVIEEADWKWQSLEEDVFDYAFYIIYKRHPYKFTFLNDDTNHTQLTWIENGEEVSVKEILYQDPISAPLMVPISSKENELAATQTYQFLGYSKTAGGDVIDLSTISAAQDMSFYAIYSKTPSSVYDNFTYIDNAEDYFSFDTEGFDDGNADYRIDSGYKLTLKDGVSLKGKVTLPSQYKGLPVISLGGFKNQLGLTHVFMQNKLKTGAKIECDLRKLYDAAFENCSNLKWFDFTDGIRQYLNRCFYGCYSLTNSHLGKSAAVYQRQAFRNAFANTRADNKHVLYIGPGATSFATQSLRPQNNGDVGPITQLYAVVFGTNTDSMWTTPSLVKDAFPTSGDDTKVDYVIVYCDNDSHTNFWSTTKFTDCIGDENTVFKYPNQGDNISNIQL